MSSKKEEEILYKWMGGRRRGIGRERMLWGKTGRKMENILSNLNGHQSI